MRFYEFDPKRDLDEGLVGDLFSWISEKIGRFFSTLKFGETKSVDIPIPEITMEAKISGVGFLHEWLVLYYLKQMVNENKQPFEVSFPDNIDQEVAERMKKYSKDRQVNDPEAAAKYDNSISVATTSAKNLASKILEDIRNGEDSAFLDEVIIQHVGGDGEGKGPASSGGKADLRVTARKKDTKEVLTLINASLKMTTTNFITLLTTSWPSMVNKLFYPNENWGIGKKAMVNFNNAMRQIPEIKKEYENLDRLEAERRKLTIEKKAAKNEKDKFRETELKREISTRANSLGRFILNVLFNHYYPQNKKKINERIMIELGLDDADTVYATFVDQQTSDDVNIMSVSSRTSPTFKSLYDKFKNGFSIDFKVGGKSGDKAIVEVTMTDLSGKDTFWRSNIGFAQNTGSYQWYLPTDIQGSIAKNG